MVHENRRPNTNKISSTLRDMILGVLEPYQVFSFSSPILRIVLCTFLLTKLYILFLAINRGDDDLIAYTRVYLLEKKIP